MGRGLVRNEISYIKPSDNNRNCTSESDVTSHHRPGAYLPVRRRSSAKTNKKEKKKYISKLSHTRSYNICAVDY